MPRYFLELSYKGTNYSGFQVQDNANTIHAETEKAIETLLKRRVVLTGSSRTDAGVHAIQNFFHFDTPDPVADWRGIETVRQFIYKMNGILPGDIAVRNLFRVPDQAHCRFDAQYREYKYYINTTKNPFLRDRAFFFPYRMSWEKLQEAAAIVKEYNDFTSFSKRNTQAKTFFCELSESEWLQKGSLLIYHVKANRFLRGMVRALTATMLQVGREKITIGQFRQVIEAKDCSRASFAVPAHGLFLLSVAYPGIDFEN